MGSCSYYLRYFCAASIAAVLIMYFLPFLSIFKKPLHLMTHYEVLGVDVLATKQEIMKAFRQQSLIYHPDKQGGNSDDKKASSNTNDYFIALVNAKETLLDEEKRRIYNEELERKRQEQFERYRQTRDSGYQAQGDTSIFAFFMSVYHKFVNKYIESDTTAYFIYNALVEFFTIRGFLNFCFVLAIASIIIQFFLPLFLDLLYTVICSVPYNCFCSKRRKEQQQVLRKNMRLIREEQQRRHLLLSGKGKKLNKETHLVSNNNTESKKGK